MAIKSSATTGASYSIVRLHMDGSATVMAGTSDMGQGARTVLTQIAAQELGLTADSVQIVMGDTGMAPFDLQTSASRSTVFMGTAVAEACRDVKRQLAELAADAFGVPSEQVEVGRGTAEVDGQHGDLLRASGPGVRRRAWRGHRCRLEARRGGSEPSSWAARRRSTSSTATAVEVEVDEETGELLVVKHVSVADVGKALNPAHVEGQDEGAAIMGLGHTLMEHLIFDEHGRILNLGALDYRIPTTKDVPLELHSYLVENEDGPGPYGSKGAGEGGLFAIAPAVASAVTEATGWSSGSCRSPRSASGAPPTRVAPNSENAG